MGRPAPAQPRMPRAANLPAPDDRTTVTTAPPPTPLDPSPREIEELLAPSRPDSSPSVMDNLLAPIPQEPPSAPLSEPLPVAPSPAAPEPSAAAPEPSPETTGEWVGGAAVAAGASGGDLMGRLPRGLLFMTGAALILGLILNLGQVIRPFGTPGKAVNELLEALADADLDTLRKEERLGFKSRVKSEVERRGRTEFYRILSLFSQARSKGKVRFLEVRRKIWKLGESAFAALPADQQSTVKNKSKDAWLAHRAFVSLSVEDQKLVGSEGTLQDRASLEALAFTAGLDSLSEDDRALIEGKNPESPEVQADPALSVLASRATRTGLSQLIRMAARANRAAKGDFRNLSRKEQSRIVKESYTDYLFKAGLALFKEADRGLIKSKASLAEANSDAAKALKTALGLSALEAKDRKEIEKLEERAFIKSKEAFIKAQGDILYAAFLKETFPEDCCSVGTVRYLGDSSRSLLRNSTAIVELEYEGSDEEEKKEAEKKEADKTEGDDKAEDKKDVAAKLTALVDAKAAADKKKKEEEEKKKKKITPKKYLGEVAIVAYEDGIWQKPSFTKMPKSEGQMKKAGAMAALKDPSTVVSVVLMAIFALVIVLAVALKRSGPAIACIEGATLAMLLGAVQSLLQGQVSMDDFLFTPLYMAIPIWIGMRRGAEAGFMAGFLMGLGLTAASALGSVATWAALAGNGLDLSEHMLAAMFLAITGAVAARIRWPKELPVAVPLLWLLFYVSIDRGLLCSMAFYGHVCWGAAMVGLGLMARELGLLKVVERVYTD